MTSLTGVNVIQVCFKQSLTLVREMLTTSSIIRVSKKSNYKAPELLEGFDHTEQQSSTNP